MIPEPLEHSIRDVIDALRIHERSGYPMHARDCGAVRVRLEEALAFNRRSELEIAEALPSRGWVGALAMLRLVARQIRASGDAAMVGRIKRDIAESIEAAVGVLDGGAARGPAVVVPITRGRVPVHVVGRDEV